MNLNRFVASIPAAIILVLLTVFPDLATAAPNSVIKPRPKIALVLEGGGARGFAHVGVIKALEESRIPVDMVTGTSMGSIVGAAYSAGRSVEEMERVLTGTDWDKLFDEEPPRSDLAYRLKAGREREIFGEAKISVNDAGLVTPGGVIDGINILPLLQQLVGDVPNPANFDHLPLRFRAVAADIATGEAVVFSKGDLARAMRASMSVPFLFTPVEIDGRLLVDGGVVDNLPVDQALAMGADIVIAIELTEEFKPKDQLKSPFAVSNQMLSFLLEDNTVRAKKLLRSGDRLVRVDLPGYGSGDFNKGKEILAVGYEAGKRAVEALKDLSLSEADYAAYKAHLRHEAPEQKIEFIEVNNSSGLPDEVITQQLSFKVGDKIDREQISADLIKIYNTGQFATIDYDYIQRDGKQGVLITVSGKEWYKQFGRFGASFEDDFQGNARYRLAVNYRKADLNSLGGYLDFEGEVGNYPRAKLEFFQPVDNGSPYFIAPIFVVRKTPILIRNSTDVLAEYERFDLAGEFTAGRELGSYGELRFGYIRGFGDLERRVGDPTLPNIDYDTGEVYSRLVIDTVDAPDFPTEGVASSIGYNRAIEDLGSSDEYDDLSGSFSKPFTFGRNTLLFNGDFGLSLGDRPIERSYSLGGFLNLSGYAKSSLLASDYAIGRMMLYRRIEEIKLPFMGVGFFGGGTLEIGTLTSDIDNVLDPGTIISSALFVGADTPIVPVYFGIGMSEGGEVSGYMALGRVGVVRQ